METSAGHFPPHPSSGRGVSKQRACAAWLAIGAHNVLGNRAKGCFTHLPWGTVPVLPPDSAVLSRHSCTGGVLSLQGKESAPQHTFAWDLGSLCAVRWYHTKAFLLGKKVPSYLELILLSFSQLTNHNSSVHLAYQQRWSPKC